MLMKLDGKAMLEKNAGRTINRLTHIGRIMQTAHSNIAYKAYVPGLRSKLANPMAAAPPIVPIMLKVLRNELKLNMLVTPFTFVTEVEKTPHIFKR
jgi:hypothetical protein